AKRFAGTGTPVAKLTGDQDKKTAAETAPKQGQPEITGPTKGEEKSATVPKSSAQPVQLSFKQSVTETAPNEIAQGYVPSDKATSTSQKKAETPKEQEQTETPATPGEKIESKSGQEKNAAKDFMARASALPGVAACSVTF